jgi:hypothetical protein
MDAEMDQAELDFASMGRFVDGPPSAPALHRHEPYRSGPHYDIQQRLRRGERVRCRLSVGTQAYVRFIVAGCPEYGVLNVIFEDEGP